MYTPHPGPSKRATQAASPDADRERSVDPLEHCACCLVGLLTVGICLLAFYPVLLAATRPLEPLSSTALVVVLVSLWVAVWAAVELAWEWRAGRVSITG